jgi:flagellar basal-body rod protein FlgB
MPIPLNIRHLSCKNVRLMTTSPMHISGNNYASAFKTVKQKDAYETAPNGNNVSIEEQMVKMSQNNTDHQEVTGLLKKLNSISAFATSGN